MDDELISTAQAAELLGVTKRRVRQASDRLGGWRTESGRYVYSRKLVQDYRLRHLRSREVEEQDEVRRLLEQLVEEVAGIRRLLESRGVNDLDRTGEP